jgi:hypothetical protein
MAGGKSVVVMLSGWNSPEELKAAFRDSSIAVATEKLEGQCRLVESFSCTFAITEKSRYEHRWRRLPPPYLKDIPVAKELVKRCW